jgi:hypothetical protein
MPQRTLLLGDKQVLKMDLKVWLSMDSSSASGTKKMKIHDFQEVLGMEKGLYDEKR